MEDPEDLTDAKLADFERFFSPLTPMLVAFAKRHNLRIDKYHRGQPKWTFLFRLVEEGSRGHVSVLWVGDDQVFILGGRERRDFERFRSFSARGGVGQLTLSRDDPQFAEQLKAMLVKVVNLPITELKRDGFDWSSRAQEFVSAREGFAAEPLVRLD